MTKKRIFCIIPAYNEGKTIGDVVKSVNPLVTKTVVIDDGSSDETAKVAREVHAIVLQHIINLGQGAALQTGIQYALDNGAEYIVTFDADGQHDPKNIPDLISALEGGYDIVIGSRFMGLIEGASLYRKIFLKFAVLVSNYISGLKLTDAHCGIRIFCAHIAHKLQIEQNRMAHASEILYKIKKYDLKVREIPVTVRYSEYSKAKGQTSLGALEILVDFFLRKY